jgi:hypothetical protein
MGGDAAFRPNAVSLGWAVRSVVHAPDPRRSPIRLAFYAYVAFLSVLLVVAQFDSSAARGGLQSTIAGICTSVMFVVVFNSWVLSRYDGREIPEEAERTGTMIFSILTVATITSATTRTVINLLW